jgi:hypothetical protein
MHRRCLIIRAAFRQINSPICNTALPVHRRTPGGLVLPNGRLDVSTRAAELDCADASEPFATLGGRGSLLGMLAVAAKREQHDQLVEANSPYS